MIVEIDSEGFIRGVKLEPGSSEIDTHVRFKPRPFIIKQDFFKAETNKERVTAQMQEWLDGMETIDLPEDIWLSERAFAGCEHLVHIRVPSNEVTIDPETFQGCKSLKTIELPMGLLAIKERAFKDCISLEAIHIPETVDYIGEGAFENCSRLHKIVLPWFMDSLDEKTLGGSCQADQIRVERDPEYILEGMFLLSKDRQTLIRCRLEGDDDIIISPSVTRLTTTSFIALKTDENNIKKLRIPENVEVIPEDIFRRVKEIKTLQIPPKILYPGVNFLWKQASVLEIIDLKGNIIGKFTEPSFLENGSPKTYDEQLTKKIEEEVAYQYLLYAALYRLSYPYQLEEEHQQYFNSIISYHSNTLIDFLIESEPEMIQRNAHLLIYRNNFNATLEKASNAKNTELVAFLLEYQHTHFQDFGFNQKKYTLDPG